MIGFFWTSVEFCTMLLFLLKINWDIGHFCCLLSLFISLSSSFYYFSSFSSIFIVEHVEESKKVLLVKVLVYCMYCMYCDKLTKYFLFWVSFFSIVDCFSEKLFLLSSNSNEDCHYTWAQIASACLDLPEIKKKHFSVVTNRFSFFSPMFTTITYFTCNRNSSVD